MNTLAVGRVAVIGVGQESAEALDFQLGTQRMLDTVLAISPRVTVLPATRWCDHPDSFH